MKEVHGRRHQAGDGPALCGWEAVSAPTRWSRRYGVGAGRATFLFCAQAGRVRDVVDHLEADIREVTRSASSRTGFIGIGASAG